MRLSKFHKKTIWFIVLSIPTIMTFIPTLGELWQNPFIWVFRFYSVVGLVAWSIGLSWTLRKIIALKYKIVEDKKSLYMKNSFQAKYLTFWWIIIPYWKSVKVKYNHCETQNVFGAKGKDTYTTEILYDKESNAIEAIEQHKKDMIFERNWWFKIPERESKKITYV